LPEKKEETIMMKRIGVVAALAGIVLMSGGIGVASATPPGNETKTGLCHRTASDSNPYVFIEVDDESLPAHLNDLPGHPPKAWKTDGIFRSVAHKAGDLKQDYKAEDASECVDNTPEQPKPVVEVEKTTIDRMSCEAGVEEQTTTTTYTTPYVWVDGEWVLGKTEKDVVVGDWVFVRDLTNEEKTELECLTPIKPQVQTIKQTKVNCDGVFLRTKTITTYDGDVTVEFSKWKKTADLTPKQEKNLDCVEQPPSSPPSTPSKFNAPPELPHTGGNGTTGILAGLGVLLVAAGGAAIKFGSAL
jgi:hypothetical protein